MNDQSADVQLAVLQERVYQLNLRIDIIKHEATERLDALKVEFSNVENAMKEEIRLVKIEMAQVKSIRDRWKGAVGILFIIGSIIGWAINYIGLYIKVPR